MTDPTEPTGEGEAPQKGAAETRFRGSAGTEPAVARAAPAGAGAPGAGAAGPGPPRGAAETRLRGFEPPVREVEPLARGVEAAPRGVGPAQPPPAVLPPSMSAPVSPALATTSEWVDPESASARGPQSGAEATIGTLLSGRYLLERRLGEGGMGVVYLASDQEVKGETFAVKVLKSEIREHPESLALLREEVRRTRALPHPNIVGVYSLNSDKSSVYMLMEFLEGKSLDALIDEDFGRGMPLERAWPLIQDIGGALAFAHDHSVIHSDLKPSNIFITTGGRAKLVDFGIARAARGRTRGVDPAALGALTPQYASCEMLEGHQPDMRDDIYALACVIYEMLSGKHPFGGRTAVEARDEKRTPAALPSLSRSQNAALASGLAFDRERRVASVEALIAGLSPAAQSKAGRLPLIVSTVVVLIVLGVGGWLWWSRASQGRGDSSQVDSAASAASAGAGAGVGAGAGAGAGAGIGAPPAALGAALEKVRGLGEEARRLEVDLADPSLVLGMQQLRVAEQQLAAGRGAEGSAALTQAEAALLTAIGTGGRVAHIGSEPDEIQLAVSLCSRNGGRCSAGDFSDETARTAVLRPFALDATEVTNGQFAEFAQAKGVATTAERGQGLFSVSGAKLVNHPGESWKTFSGGAEGAQLPVRGIDFESAKAYCAWVGKRLPTEEEWEYVARPDHRIFPWGNDPAGATAATSQRLLPVTEQPATGRFESRGLGGSLWEWVEGGSASDRVFRGASWLDTDIVHRRLAQRGLESPTRAHVDTGFRCAQSVDRWPTESGAAG